MCIWKNTITGIFLLVSGMAFGQAAETVVPSRIWIQLGDPNLKKTLLALDPVKGDSAVASEFAKTLDSNLEFTDMFEFVPQEKLPKVGGISPGTFSMEEYKKLGPSFLIKSQVNSGSKGSEAEVRVYEVATGGLLLSKRYPFVGSSSRPGRELAHAVGNDIMKTLTGEAGVFRTRILMSCGLKKKEIYIMDFDGENVTRLTRDNDFALSPAWSPDALKFAFTSYKPAIKGTPKNPNLYMYDLVTNQRKTLSAARGLNTGAAFHPTQNKILYTFSPDGQGKPEIYVLDLNTNTRKKLTSTQFFTVEASWAPDGNRIAYSSSLTGRPHLYVADPEGKNAKRLTFAGYYNSSPKWSPKGDRIVFSGQENRANNFNVFLIDPSGSNLVRLTDAAGYSNENPSFSPDGRHIVVSSNEGGTYRIKSMTARGTHIRTLSPANLGHCKQPDWSARL